MAEKISEEEKKRKRDVIEKLTIAQPDDWHLHLRDGARLKSLMSMPMCSRRAIVMPNLKPPVTTTEMALAYRKRILDAHPESDSFEPLMTLYLTDNTTPEEIRKAKASGHVKALKLYPAGATTNSDSGVTNPLAEKLKPTFRAMAETGLLLLIHGEVTDSDVDFFDREAVFIERTLKTLVKEFPKLKIVLEHITTKQAANFVMSAPANVAATITPQHLLYNRNIIFEKGLKPHYYCLPILKAEDHRQALVKAVQSGSKKFFLGTDSAPHWDFKKECDCCAAGCFTQPIALELYAEAFDNADALDKLEAFSSFNGPDFYGLPRNTGRVSLTREKWTVPESYGFGDGKVKPLRSGKPVFWRVRPVYEESEMCLRPTYS
eukprot:g2049.t1